MFYVRNQFVRGSKHSLPRFYGISRLMLYKAKVAVFFWESYTTYAVYATWERCGTVRC